MFALFYCVFEGFLSTCPPGGLIFGGTIERRVFALRVLGGLYLEGVGYIWRGLFSEFYGTFLVCLIVKNTA